MTARQLTSRTRTSNSTHSLFSKHRDLSSLSFERKPPRYVPWRGGFFTDAAYRQPATRQRKRPGLLRASSLPTAVVAIMGASIVSRAAIVIRIRSATIIAVSRPVVTVVGGIGRSGRANHACSHAEADRGVTADHGPLPENSPQRSSQARQRLRGQVLSFACTLLSVAGLTHAARGCCRNRPG